MGCTVFYFQTPYPYHRHCHVITAGITIPVIYTNPGTHNPPDKQWLVGMGWVQHCHSLSSGGPVSKIHPVSSCLQGWRWVGVVYHCCCHCCLGIAALSCWVVSGNRLPQVGNTHLVSAPLVLPVTLAHCHHLLQY